MTSGIPARLLERAHQQQGIISRKQALTFGMSAKAIRCQLEYGRWQTIYPGVYAVSAGSISRAARLWAVVLYAGPGARLSHETAAELLGLSDGESALVHATIQVTRKVSPPEGVIIHRSSHPGKPWQPYRMPPHTFVEDTILDLVDAAVNLDEVIVLVTTAFARKLASEPHLKRAAAERKKLRWRRELHEIVSNGADGTHSILEYRHDPQAMRDRETGGGGAPPPRLDRQPETLLTHLPGGSGFPGVPAISSARVTRPWSAAYTTPRLGWT